MKTQEFIMMRSHHSSENVAQLWFAACGAVVRRGALVVRSSMAAWVRAVSFLAASVDVPFDGAKHSWHDGFDRYDRKRDALKRSAACSYRVWPG